MSTFHLRLAHFSGSGSVSSLPVVSSVVASGLVVVTPASMSMGRPSTLTTPSAAQTQILRNFSISPETRKNGSRYNIKILVFFRKYFNIFISMFDISFGLFVRNIFCLNKFLPFPKYIQYVQKSACLVKIRQVLIKLINAPVFHFRASLSF